jgi:hypothetical protein
LFTLAVVNFGFWTGKMRFAPGHPRYADPVNAKLGAIALSLLGLVAAIPLLALLPGRRWLSTLGLIMNGLLLAVMGYLLLFAPIFFS